jgi:hypothetical protein
MKIVNHTHYGTEALRALFAAGLRHLEAPSKGKVVEVVYTRPGDARRAAGCAGYVSGKATLGRRSGGSLYHGRYITMRLPSDPALLDVGAVARVWDHEVRHTMGVRHRSMTEAIRKCMGPTPSWAVGRTIPMQVSVKPPPAERRAARKAAREAHAREMLARWQKKYAAAKARVRKWAARVRYYERQASTVAGEA